MSKDSERQSSSSWIRTWHPRSSWRWFQARKEMRLEAPPGRRCKWQRCSRWRSSCVSRTGEGRWCLPSWKASSDVSGWRIRWIPPERWCSCPRRHSTRPGIPAGGSECTANGPHLDENNSKCLWGATALNCETLTWVSNRQPGWGFRNWGYNEAAGGWTLQTPENPIEVVSWSEKGLGDW